MIRSQKPNTAKAPKALLLLGLLTPLLTAPLLAQPARAQAATTQTINLPAQPLDQAVIDLARQTGLAIGGDASLLEGKQAPALSGDYTPTQALRSLLAGSGVIAVRVENGYRLEAAPQETGDSNTLDAVSVYGRQKNDTVEAIPQSVSVYNRENFELAQANTVGDIVRLTPAPTGPAPAATCSPTTS
ncbi:Fe(3+) dicitrate transport protein FecA [Alcanivorax sp. ALC70]|nr:Fe(3+) dicitrate transport protein FecA [Alcanivorax sp. ALC70]